jgi:hypothetical protein
LKKLTFLDPQTISTQTQFRYSNIVTVRPDKALP